MGKKDLWQSDYFENRERFADVFNGILFQGSQVVKAEELEEADSEIVFHSDNNTAHKVIRDKVRKWKGTYFSILVLESQSYIDYRMVLRAMKSEVLGYEKQRQLTYEQDKKNGVPFDGHEFLSKMRKGQKFTPIVTLVLYLGIDKPWDGARTLYGLLDMNQALVPFINNYRLNLYDYHDYQDFSAFQTENRCLFEILSCSGDKEKMKNTMRQHPDLYSSLDKESAVAILGITGMKINLETIKEKNGKREVYDVCKAFEDYKEEGRMEGRMEGKIEILKENILELLNNYGSITKETYSRITAENSVGTLKQIFKAAAKAESMEQFVNELSTIY